jgi:murein peptide amidase A
MKLIPHSSQLIFGKTALGLPIPGYKFGTKGKKILILGGVHGDEPEGVIATMGLLDQFSQDFHLSLQVFLVPTFNLDGVIAQTRMNSNGVDLNRNLPTQDWTPEIQKPRYNPGPHPLSESENKALVEFISNEKPDFILSMHSWNPMLNINGDCMNFAKVISNMTGYKIEHDIGYPTPGSLGTYAGIEKHIPTLTYEVEKGLRPEYILSIHVPAILTALKTL